MNLYPQRVTCSKQTKRVGGVKFPPANTYLNRSQKLTANEINAMMTIPRVPLSLFETAAMIACPPMVLFRIRKLCAESAAA
jgi:hypothetical protein